MKIYFNIALTVIIVFFIAKSQLFKHKINPVVYESTIVDMVIFRKSRDSFVGQQVKLGGVVRNSRFVLGIGYYELVAFDGTKASVFCDHYPPLDNDIIEIVIYIYPVIKFGDAPITLQVEVKVPV